MVDIREFQSGQLYGLKIRDRTLRANTRRVVASKYNDQLHGFEARAISAEGVGRGYQTLNFETEEQAREWCNTELAQQLTGYTAIAFELVRTGAGRYQRIPLAGVPFDGWVCPYKFQAPVCISERQLQHLIEVAPEYFDEEAAGPAANNSQTSTARGFFR